jgi:signal peptidase I
MGRSSATLQARGAPKATTVETRAPTSEGHRDTVEAIVVAFILALVVRGFEAQAFVIPTGSMAPTLMGRHKELACHQCGFLYAVNASEEAEPRRDERGDRDVPEVYLDSAVCGNCRFQERVEPLPSFKGDRILVMMFPYDLPFLPGSGPPERWDVVVFRYPEEPEVSYIKRLVGLPGETIRILHGDIFIKPPGGDGYALARKPLRHQSAMQIAVYNDRFQPSAFHQKPEWQRWTSEKGDWVVVEPGASRYQTKGSGEQWSELRYRHLVPDPEQWASVLNDQTPARAPRATLVTDFYSYNTNIMSQRSRRTREVARPPDESQVEGAWMQPHWVGDLSLQGDIEVRNAAAGGSVRLELVKAGTPHRCTIDLATGTAVVTRGEDELGRWETAIKGTGRHHVDFANVDDRVSLVVDGRPSGGDGIEYDSPQSIPVPTEADLAPAAIAARNAEVVASDLVLKRDIYYTQKPGYNDYSLVWDQNTPRSPAELLDFLSDPSRFPSLASVRSSEYEIGADRFFMMGDNSPRSKDSRGWGSDDAEWDTSERKTWEVPRQLLTGKAFYVYWPHGAPFGPDIRINHDNRIFFRPYFERMKWIR